MRNIYLSIVVLLNLLLADISLAYEVAVEFSATAVQIAPGRPDYQRQMYVGKNMVRTDSVRNETQLIEIVKTEEELRLLLIPKEKIYMQQKSLMPAKSLLSDNSTSTKLCAGMQDTSCELLGKEMINNREAEKWEFIVEQGDQTYLSLHWIDVERRILVREFLPDGTLTELLPAGTEIINGRHTEKWFWRLSIPGGYTKTATQWYDPELRITIREELQGGFIRELRDIKTQKQDKTLFEIPDGYKQVENLPAYVTSQQPDVSSEN